MRPATPGRIFAFERRGMFVGKNDKNSRAFLKWREQSMRLQSTPQRGGPRFRPMLPPTTPTSGAPGTPVLAKRGELMLFLTIRNNVSRLRRWDLSPARRWRVRNPR